MRLTINQISEPDEGEYYCHAENVLGAAVQPVSVRIRNIAASHNITQCCMEQNVSSSCMNACSFYLDIDAVIDKPECITDFDKLMKCAADGSGILQNVQYFPLEIYLLMRISILQIIEVVVWLGVCRDVAWIGAVENLCLVLVFVFFHIRNK